MSHILMPVDFTPVAANALRYLLEATTEEDYIDLLHVSTGIVNLSEAPIVQNLQQNEAAVREKMKEYFSKSLSLEKLPERCTVRADTGEIVTTIVGRSKTRGIYNKIVMGTRDKYDLFDKWLGTISLGVVKRSDLPVMLIPPKTSHTKIENCLIAGDQHLCESDNLDLIAKWNAKNKSFLHFVHVGERDEEEFQNTAESIIRSYYETKDVDFGYDISKIPGDDVVEALIDYARKNNCQLIVVLPEKQSFLDALFLRSVSKELILKSSVPMLFLK